MKKKKERQIRKSLKGPINKFSEEVLKVYDEIYENDVATDLGDDDDFWMLLEDLLIEASPMSINLGMRI